MMVPSRTVVVTYATLAATIIAICTYFGYSLHGVPSNTDIAFDNSKISSHGGLTPYTGQPGPGDQYGPVGKTAATDARDRVDQKYCGGPCRFLLPIFIAEQESKAQVHVRQLAFLSGLLNRTFVLPNMEESKLSVCYKNEFTRYYDKEWVERNSMYFSAITMSEFTSWLEERQAIGEPPASHDMAIHMTHKNSEYERRNCLAGKMNMVNLPTSHLWLAEDFAAHRTDDVLERIISQFLTGQPVDDPAEPVEYPPNMDIPALIQGLDVLSVYYNRRSPIVQNPVAEQEIPFNRDITKLVDAIADPISPYWAIHWRMETIYPPERLVYCAHALVSLIEDLRIKAHLDKPPTIFLLTDYPHVFNEQIIEKGIEEGKDGEELGLKSTSATFHASILKEGHHRAIQHLYHHLQLQVTAMAGSDLEGTPANWTVVPIPESVTQGDIGMLGVIDKMLAIRAQVFIAGKQAVCARASSFTRRIITDRVERRTKESHGGVPSNHWHGWDDKNPDMMKNIVDYFGYPKGYNP